MANFAKIENGIVIQVIVAEQDVINTGLFGDPKTYVQTSFNTRGGVHYAPNSNTPDNGIALRANYAGIGFTYDEKNDVFIPPKPLDHNGIVCDSWIASEPDWLWKPPIPKPTATAPNYYAWDETTKSWEIKELASNQAQS